MINKGNKPKSETISKKEKKKPRINLEKIFYEITSLFLQ